MAVQYAFGQIVTNGLVLALDAADRNSYVSGSTTWRDMSGNGYNGGFASIGSIFPIYSSLAGGGIVFDQANAYITSSYSYSSSPLLWSTSVWFNPTNYSNGPFLVGGASAVGFTETIQITGAGKVVGATKNSGNNSYSVTTSTSAPINSWTNFVVTVDWAGNSIKGYFNGNLESTNTSTSGSIMNSTSATHIGRRPDGGNYFGGTIAIIQTYNRALSAAEVAQNYNAQKSRFGL
jgi:hypothetical protein